MADPLSLNSVCILESPNNDNTPIIFYMEHARNQMVEDVGRGSAVPEQDWHVANPITESTASCRIHYQRTVSSQSSEVRNKLSHRYSVDDSSRGKVEEWLSEQENLSPKLNNPRFWDLKKSISSPGGLHAIGCTKTRSHTIPPIPKSVTSEAHSGSVQMQVTMGNSTLSPLDERQIRRLIGDKRLMLPPLYQASVHGFDPLVFHSLCDKRGPSVTIVTLTSGLCFGCYTSVGWFSRGEPANDKKAFLFKAKDHLADDLKITATQSDSDQHIYDDQDLGPFFGSSEKPTLRLFCKVYQSKSAQIYSGGPFVGASLLELTGVENGALDVADVEVFDASQRYPPILERAWREVTLNQTTTLVDNINYFVKYKPEFCQIDYVNVLLLGPTGSGKSSLFNTFESTFKGHITSRARTGDGKTSTTKQFRRYAMSPQCSKEYLNIRICDTPGLSTIDISPTDLVYILDGHLSDRFALSTGSLITNRSTGFNSDTSIRDEMHCIVLVLDATSIPLTGTPLHSKILELREQIVARDIPIRVVLTKTDLACKHVEANLCNIYKSCTITDIVDTVNTNFGIPRNHIYPLKCYEHEIKQVHNIGILVTSAFQNIIYAAESCLEDRESLQCYNTEPSRKLRSASNVSAGSVPGSTHSLSIGVGRNRSASDMSNNSPILLNNMSNNSPVFRRSNSEILHVSLPEAGLNYSRGSR